MKQLWPIIPNNINYSNRHVKKNHTLHAINISFKKVNKETTKITSFYGDA